MPDRPSTMQPVQKYRTKANGRPLPRGDKGAVRGSDRPVAQVKTVVSFILTEAVGQ